MRTSNKGVVHLTSKIDYALFLLVALAENKSNEPISIREFAKNNKMSFSFLQKVAYGLRQEGIIDATRGKDGGYTLNVDPNELSLKDIVHAIEGPISIMHCLSGSMCRRNSICSIRSHLNDVNKEIDHLFESKKLSSFIN